MAPNRDHSPEARREPSRFNGLFRDVPGPADFTHHTAFRDAPPELFDLLCRDLRLRLYHGVPRRLSDVRCAFLRQGISGRLGSVLLTLSALLAVGSMWAGRATTAATASWTHAGLSAWWAALLESPFLAFGLVAALAGTGLALCLMTRRYFWLLCRENADGRVDVWVSGSGWRHGERFDREFAAFETRARQLIAELDAPEAPPVEAETATG